jgi:hypothetical protein
MLASDSGVASLRAWQHAPLRSQVDPSPVDVSLSELFSCAARLRISMQLLTPLITRV